MSQFAQRSRVVPLAVVTWATLVAACWLLEGKSPPHVNEAHYLCKARHYVDARFAAGDLFLESRDAHTLFFATFGPLTRIATLETTAWVGRWLVWSAIAAALMAVLRAAQVPPRWWATTGLACFVLWQVTPMAGEWVIGGIEGKGLAVVFAIIGLALAIRGSWELALIACGAATAWHVLVGGWLGLLVGCGLLRYRGWSAFTSPRVYAAAALALGLASIGVLPALALNAHVDADVAQRASMIYVYDRLAHHLVFQRFPPLMIARHFAAWGVFFGLWFIGRDRDDLKRLAVLIWGAGVLLLLGVAGGSVSEWRPDLAAPWLRYYFFRTPDWLLPIGLAVFGSHAVADRLRGSKSWLLGLAVTTAAFSWIAINGSQIMNGPIPPACRQSGLTRGERGSRSTDAVREWQTLGGWIRDHTPSGAIFITPRRQQTFKWYAERAEVVNWKDVPQDAPSLVEWWERYQRVYPPQVIEQGLVAHGAAGLRAIASRYGAQWLVVDRRRAPYDLPWKPAYPPQLTDETRFVVYRIPRTPIDEHPVPATR